MMQYTVTRPFRHETGFKSPGDTVKLTAEELQKYGTCVGQIATRNVSGEKAVAPRNKGGNKK